MPRRIPTYRPRAQEGQKAQYETRPERMADKRFYASTPWLRLRVAFLREHPLCGDCEKVGRIGAAVHVHHVKERKTHPGLALEWDNLEATCQACHNAKRGNNGQGQDAR